jgi:aminopeptidase-like protein/NADP-dependent 3-hydroxy acid dehydrogenase YdfG
VTTSLTRRPEPADTVGGEAYELMTRLFPLCRSLTGDGVRRTFDLIEEEIEISRTEIPSGTQLFDWVVPDEWNIRDAYIADADGNRVVDFRRSTLHVVSYSEPVRTTLSLDALRERLHTLPDDPDAVPYRTSYHDRTWGFCLSHRQLLELAPGDYEVVIDSTLAPGHLSYAEATIEGEGEEEVLFSTYVCHPSLANDNLSGIAVATMLAKRLQERRLRHTYRFLFAPGTLGPLAWLHENRDRLDRVRNGLALSCIGDAGGLTYKRSRRGDAEIDLAIETVLRDSGGPHRLLPWEPWGGDERQFCSPGFDLPVGTLMRTPHGEFAGYHTSADAMERIRPDSLAHAVDTCLALVDVLESNRTCTNLSPYGEPQLGRRGLYRSAGGAVATPDDERALLWVLNASDGRSSLLDVAHSSRIPYPVVERAAERLEHAGLLEAGGRRGGGLEGRTCVVTGASSGIGAAIALALTAEGATVCGVGRRREGLDETASRVNGAGRFVACEADLLDDREPERLTSALIERHGHVDVLVHAAGTIALGAVETAAVEDLDRLYATNVRAAYRLTQGLLPALRDSQGQIVFINSTVGLAARANVAQYAATKQALRAIADSLREEVNPLGIRVLSVYPGRTATPLQAGVHEDEGRPYSPERLVQPADVASLVVNALTLPRSAEVTDITVRPMLKP